MEQQRVPQPDIQTANLSFEEQLTQNRRNIEYPGGSMNILHIKPENPEGEPILYHYGWGADDDIIGKDLKYFYDQNREVVTISKPITDRPPKVKDSEEYSGYTLRNALAEVAIAEELGFAKINMLGHSLGTSNTLLAANLMLERGIKIENIILVNPTGFGRPSKPELARRQLTMMLQEMKRDLPSKEKKLQADEIVKSTLKTLVRHPRSLVGEGFGVSEVNMSELTRRILRQDIPISIVHSADDPYVHVEDLNTEVQLAAQTVRQERVRMINETINSMTLDELQKNDVSSQTLSEQELRRLLFDERIKDLQKAEENNPLLSSVPEGGHFLTEYPKSYLPIVVEMFNRNS